jgi:hypothetical protein
VDAAWAFPKGTLFVTMIVSPNFQGRPTPPTCVGTANITGTYQITMGRGPTYAIRALDHKVSR